MDTPFSRRSLNSPLWGYGLHMATRFERVGCGRGGSLGGGETWQTIPWPGDPGQHHQGQVLWTACAHRRDASRRNVTSVVSSETHSHSLAMKRHQPNPNEGAFLQMPGQYPAKCEGREKQRKLSNCQPGRG